MNEQVDLSLLLRLLQLVWDNRTYTRPTELNPDCEPYQFTFEILGMVIITQIKRQVVARISYNLTTISRVSTEAPWSICFCQRASVAWYFRYKIIDIAHAIEEGGDLEILLGYDAFVHDLAILMLAMP